MHLPRAEFWRLWLRAFVVIGLLATFALTHPLRAETMRTSFYGSESGRRTASGARFDPMGFTAAHRSLPFGSRLRVCLAACAVVTVNDRGPFAHGRDLDLSRGAARAIGLEARGVAAIQVERLD